MRRVEYPKNSADDEVFVLQEGPGDKHMGKHGHHGLVVPRILYGALQSPSSMVTQYWRYHTTTHHARPKERESMIH